MWTDKKQTIGFRSVAENVWDSHIDGYQVCVNWLKDRKRRTLATVDIAHYHKIDIALTEAIRLMAGNLIFGGLVGAAVDGGTGAMHEHKPNPLHVHLDKQ